VPISNIFTDFRIFLNLIGTGRSKSSGGIIRMIRMIKIVVAYLPYGALTMD
jgi:hypothetical protein